MSRVSQQSSAGRVFIAILLAVMLVLGILFYVFKGRLISPATAEQGIGNEAVGSSGDNEATGTEDTAGADQVRKTGDSNASVSGTLDAQTGSDPAKQPEEIVKTLQNAIAKGDMEFVLESYGVALSEDAKRAILEFGANNKGEPLSLRNVGVLEFDKKKRWAIMGGDGQELHIDVLKTEGGHWKISSATVPTAENTALANKDGDALATADVFIKNLLNQNFDEALKFVDKKSVSDVQIAGLCIMFEEGKYKLNSQKPLNSLFLREGLAAFTVNLLESEDLSKGQLELALQKNGNDEAWKVSELNIQKLLKSYIDKVSDGDSYYTPLIKNPQGGDRLALFFEFNDDSLTLRAKSQLDIVASLVKSSQAKKLTLSGHADAIGSDGYNKSLSYERAKSVSDYLIAKGLKRDQIELSAYGETKPRSDNETDQGRRANRRTEIFLDF